MKPTATQGYTSDMLAPSHNSAIATTAGARVYTLDVPMVVRLKTGMRPLTHNDRMHWRRRADAVKTIRGQVAAHARNPRIPAAEHITVQLHYAPGDRRSVTDAPNLTATSKPAIDGLVDAGIVPDDTDKHVTELMPVIHPGPGERRLWLEIQHTEVAP